MRSPNSSKPDACTERVDVDATGIGGKEVRITRGDLIGCLYGLRSPRGGGMDDERSAEGIVDRLDSVEGPNVDDRTEVRSFDGDGETG